MFEAKESVTLSEGVRLEMKVIAYLMFFLLLGSAPAFAQTGELKGVVTDESGGVVAGAKVTLASSSGQLSETASNKEGAYSFSSLPFGECRWRFAIS